MKTKVDIVWIIAGVHGAYCGWWLTRSEAIAEHCRLLGQNWRYCKRKGDYATKANLVFEQR